MKQKDAYEQLCREYLGNCKVCDSCVAEVWCIENQVKKSRVPQKDCTEKLKEYFRQRKQVYFAKWSDAIPG